MVMDKEKTFYVNNNYITKDRWNNYWHQLQGVRMFGEALNVLEIGPGGKIVSGLLSKLGFSVKTLDINKNIEPDYVASADHLPMADKSFDVVLAAEILEHLPFDKFGKALSEIKRVSKIGAVVSFPHSGYVFSFSFKIPLMKGKPIIFKIPHFWKTKTSTEYHRWEIGLKNYPTKRIVQEIKKAGFKIIKKNIARDDPAHMFFILKDIN